MSNLVPDPKTEPTMLPAARPVGSRNTVSGPAPIVDTHALAAVERTRRIVAIMSNRGDARQVATFPTLASHRNGDPFRDEAWP